MNKYGKFQLITWGMHKRRLSYVESISPMFQELVLDGIGCQRGGRLLVQLPRSQRPTAAEKEPGYEQDRERSLNAFFAELAQMRQSAGVE